MAVPFMTFVTLSAMVMVLAEEPENRDDEAAKKHKEHLSPLVVTFVELGRDDLTAGDVNESAARKSQECNIDEGITLGDLHAYDDSNGRGESKNSEEQKNLLQREASPCESSSKRYSCG